MKLDQQQQAQHLYFQSDLSKTEIADALGISRRTLHHWIRQNNWDQAKKNAETIPSFLAENCYQVLGNFTGQLLSESRIGQPIMLQEVNAVYKLTLAINRLKNKNTLNESMETLGLFMESVNDKDPELAEQMQPYLDEYITARAAQSNKHKRSKPTAFTHNLDQNIEKTKAEAKLDEEDLIAWSEEENAHQAAPPATVIPPSPAPVKLEATPPVPHAVHKSIRQMLRGTATTGPSRVLTQKRSAAA
jgi:hypothetical protein